MNRLDKIIMTGLSRTEYLFYKFLYYFMFRDCKNCNSFCLTCKEFDKCMENTKKVYKLKHEKW